MSLERPDLSGLDPQVKAYIESLEQQIEELTAGSRGRRTISSEPAEPSEPETSVQVITISRNWIGKRTPRHLYTRQRRGGMGVFDLETPENDPPAQLLLADRDQDLLLITDYGRAYRLPVSKLPETEVRERGEAFLSGLRLQGDEQPRIIMPARDQGYLTLVSERGYVRLLRYNYVAANMRPGSAVFDAGRFGPVAAAAWTSGEGELFIVTRQGKAIRFKEKMVHANGSLGIRLERGDEIAAVTGVTEDSLVFLLSADGKGTLRQMAGFAANKAPGAGGKTALKTDQLVGAQTCAESDDIFIISRLSKMIRFQASEIPPKEGVVQGVNCMSLRADEAVAVTIAELAAVPTEPA